MADFTIRQNDLLSPISGVLRDPAGALVDLTQVGTTVKFQMVLASDLSIKINAAATIVAPATDARVRYDFAGTDTSTAGDYLATWEVTFPSTKKQTFPTDSDLSIKVFRDLA